MAPLYRVIVSGLRYPWRLAVVIVVTEDASRYGSSGEPDYSIDAAVAFNPLTACATVVELRAGGSGGGASAAKAPRTVLMVDAAQPAGRRGGNLEALSAWAPDGLSV